jgi:cellulose biosynthesis protein BcsQ
MELRDTLRGVTIMNTLERLVIDPVTLLPPVQRAGCPVFALTSFPGGTSKSSLSALFGRGEMSKRYLVIDASMHPALQYFYEPNTYLVKQIANPLDQLIEEIRVQVHTGKYRPVADWHRCITPIEGTKGSVDVLYSNYKPKMDRQDWSILAHIINSARLEYDRIILDMRSGRMEELLPLLATVNHVLIPFRCRDWKFQFRSLRNIDDLVVNLRLLGYPIRISGVVPVFDSQPLDRDMYMAGLMEILGDVVWPGYVHEEAFEQFVFKLNNNDFEGHKYLLEKFRHLKGKPNIIWPEKRAESTFIWDFVRPALLRSHQEILGLDMDDPIFKRMSYQIAELKAKDEYEKIFGYPLTVDKVQNILRDLTILKTKADGELEAMLFAALKFREGPDLLDKSP